MQQDLQQKPVTVSGIVSTVFGGIALLTSFIPIINNVGAVLGIIAVMGTRANGKKSGRALAVVGLVISVVSVAIVLALQAQWAAMLS